MAIYCIQATYSTRTSSSWKESQRFYKSWRTHRSGFGEKIIKWTIPMHSWVLRGGDWREGVGRGGEEGSGERRSGKVWGGEGRRGEGTRKEGGVISVGRGQERCGEWRCRGEKCKVARGGAHLKMVQHLPWEIMHTCCNIPRVCWFVSLVRHTNLNYATIKNS